MSNSFIYKTQKSDRQKRLSSSDVVEDKQDSLALIGSMKINHQESPTVMQHYELPEEDEP